MSEHIFRGRVAVTGWVDGDTFHGVLDQGRGMFHGAGLTVNRDDLGVPRVEVQPIRHRCALIQAPELRNERGPAARQIARDLAPPGIYDCFTYKADDNFDRPLVDLILPDGSRFSTRMLEGGYATTYRG